MALRLSGQTSTFLVVLYFVYKSSWEFIDNRNFKKRKQFRPEILGAMLGYCYIERGQLDSRGIYLQACSINWKLQWNRRQIFPFTRDYDTWVLAVKGTFAVI